MSGGGQEDPFYPLQKAPFPLEDSALFGLDCKDKAGQNDYTQVMRLHTDGTACNSLDGRGRLIEAVFSCWP